MKFKYLMIAFSILIVFILLILALFPSFISEPSASANLRLITLPLLLSMVFILVCFGIYFLLNYRLLSLLEREDWPALAYYLEQKIYVKNSYSDKNVRLLASSYMVISDYMSVLKLESKANLAKPSVVEKNILIFGSARVLSGNYPEAAGFFRSHLDRGNVKTGDKNWVQWFYGFSHLLNSSFHDAEAVFLTMAASSTDALITGISSYFLHNNLAKYSLDNRKCLSTADHGRDRVKQALLNGGGWKKEVDKMATEIHIAIIRKYIDEAGAWIFRGEEHTESVKEIDKDLHEHDHVKEHSREVHSGLLHPHDHTAHHLISDKKSDLEESNLDDLEHNHAPAAPDTSNVAEEGLPLIHHEHHEHHLFGHHEHHEGHEHHEHHLFGHHEHPKHDLMEDENKDKT